jgi:hypothetical protein
MNTKGVAGITILTLFLFMGCAGNYAHLRNLSDSESKAAQQDLLDNWSDYNIWYDNLVIVFDPKNDNKKILVGNYWSTVNDQETWTRLVNGNERLPWGYTNQVWGNEIREIWFTHNQFYGYITHAPNVLVSAQIVDETTVRVFRSRSEDRRNY